MHNNTIINDYYAPMVIQRDGRSERAMDIYSRLLQERIIYVTGPIEPNMANAIKAQLILLEHEDPKADITMYIDSPGGQVDTGLGIYDTMQYITCDVRTVCVGLAASMGSLLLMGGTKGKRMALPHSNIMIHQPSGGSQGMASDMEIVWEHMKHTKEVLTKLYVKHTGQKYEDLLEDMDRDCYMTAEEALEYGLIDKIVTRHDGTN